MIDTHAHIASCTDSPEAIQSRAEAAGVTRVINVALSVESGLEAAELFKKCPFFVPTLGLYPSEATKAYDISAMADLFSKHPFVAVGEIGLDSVKDYAPMDAQIRLFRDQLDLAKQLGLPAIIHNRGTDAQMLAIFKDFPGVRKVFHCYSSSFDFAEALLADDPECMFSFTGMITFAKRGKTINSLRSLPLERIMIETDCPYLSPKSFQGQANEPAFVSEILAKVAEVRGLSIEDADRVTSQNAIDFFNL